MGLNPNPLNPTINGLILYMVLVWGLGFKDLRPCPFMALGDYNWPSRDHRGTSF